MTAAAPTQSVVGRRSLAIGFGALAGAGGLAALAVVFVPALGDSLYPEAPRATLAGAGAPLELLVHNSAVALWPLCLLALDWHAIPVVRRISDGLIAAQLALHGASVGAALATWPQLVRWLPHLPAEYCAIALPCAAWIGARQGRPPRTSELRRVAGATACLLAPAAALETWGTPS